MPAGGLSTTRPLLLTSRGTTTARELASLAAGVAASLPAAPGALNLCEKRENFLAAFVALLMRGQQCLLPPSRAPVVIGEVMLEHPGCYRLDDSMVESCRSASPNATPGLPDVAGDRVVVVGYTSGSTGRPKANPKTWSGFLASTEMNASRLRQVLGAAPHREPPWLLATVPSQHMYGMEMSVLLPLFGGMALHGAHPLYPADIAAALAELPEPRVLVTTPVHLRAVLQSGVDLPPLAAAVSATAPLSAELASAVEQRFDTTVLEFFGSTETCVIASRRTAREEAWLPYRGVTLDAQESRTLVSAPWFPEPVVLHDVLELREGGRFVVRGRNSDLIEVGGKRASLADLTRRLLAVPGVEDAIVFQLDGPAGAAVHRVAALVVAPDLTESDVLAGLAGSMDPVFLPRPLRLVGQLPRNEVGKVPRDRLLDALRNPLGNEPAGAVSRRARPRAR
jgi:acyl-coenzyme A synthetase/AMP-(fatty) acid ligase